MLSPSPDKPFKYTQHLLIIRLIRSLLLTRILWFTCNRNSIQCITFSQLWPFLPTIYHQLQLMNQKIYILFIFLFKFWKYQVTGKSSSTCVLATEFSTSEIMFIAWLFIEEPLYSRLYWITKVWPLSSKLYHLVGDVRNSHNYFRNDAGIHYSAQLKKRKQLLISILVFIYRQETAPWRQIFRYLYLWGIVRKKSTSDERLEWTEYMLKEMRSQKNCLMQKADETQNRKGKHLGY